MVDRLADVPRFDGCYSGNVVITFVVETDGAISNIKVMRNIAHFGEALEKIVNSFPRWIPGERDGYAVRTSEVLRIKVGLE